MADLIYWWCEGCAENAPRWGSILGLRANRIHTKFSLLLTKEYPSYRACYGMGDVYT
jgi:hypothetical protein